MKSTKFEKMFGYGGVKGIAEDVKEGLTKPPSTKQSMKTPGNNKSIPKTSTWDKIKAGMVNAREKKRQFVKGVNWVQDFVGDSGTNMAEGLVGSPKRVKREKEQPRTDRYMPIRKKPPPKQSLLNGSAFLRSL